MRGLEDDETLHEFDAAPPPTAGSDHGTNSATGRLFGKSVLQHGEVQISGGMFRKKNHYLVLTEAYLLRFKSQTRAVEMYPSMAGSGSKVNSHRQSMPSFGSSSDMHASAVSDIVDGVPLHHIVATAKLDDGRPYFAIEVSYLDEAAGKASSLVIQLNNPHEADHWLSNIRNSASQARAELTDRPAQAALAYVAQMLDREKDYDPSRLRLFKVVRRSAYKTVVRSSIDDYAKVNASLCYLAIGINKIHLVPPRISNERSSSSSLHELDSPLSFGILTLASMSLQNGDDSFQLSFRIPLQSSSTLQLASAKADEIVISIKRHANYLRPQWVHQPFGFSAPKDVQANETSDEVASRPQKEEEEEEDNDHGCFDRTLIAYCAGFNVDVSRICYTIDYDCEEAPCFRLLKPIRSSYGALELLAVLKALRYNESFSSIALSGINLDALQSVNDMYGVDTDALYTRTGAATHLSGQKNLSLLAQEIRALALKSRSLRRLDFSYCLSRRHCSGSSDETTPCGIPEALIPLSKKKLTNIGWLVLTGIRLGDPDLDHLVDAASQPVCRIQALEVGNCGLSVHDVDVLLSTLAIQESTLEVIDISDAQGRFSPELLQRQIGYFGHIRRLNLSGVQKSAGPEPLIASETLMTWRLEELQLSRTAINPQTVEGLAAYLASPRSDSLRELGLNQCGLTGRDLATLFVAMHGENDKPRMMHVSASENRLNSGYQDLFDLVKESKTPTHLTMRMIEFEKEIHFRVLVGALQHNTSLKVLDISKASLPYDAGEETCRELQKVFAQNICLEELDISGEQAHLDSARFGIGLNLALTGLQQNTTLRMLRIEHQNLGMQGANTLAEVLEANETLKEIHCDNNDINLQSFTVLVNGLQKNKTIIHMPSMSRDREKSLEKIRREIKAMNTSSTPVGISSSSSIKRTLNSVRNSRGSRSSLSAGNQSPTLGYTDRDTKATLAALQEKWDSEDERMQSYLLRNYHLCHSLPWDENQDPSVTKQTATMTGTYGERYREDALKRLEADSSPAHSTEELHLDWLDATSRPLLVANNSAPFSLPDEG